MVILYEPFGGLSNNLFQHIHFNSFCHENGVPFVNYYLENNEDSGTRNAWSTRLIFRFRKPLVFFGLVRLLDFKSEGDHTTHEQRMRSGKITFVKGWGYRNKPLTLMHRDFYRTSFYRSMELSTEGILDPKRINIAVHVRRGDYKTWQNGKYYYADDTYLRAIDQVLNFVKGDCKILVFSNDPALNKTAYQSKYSNIYISKLDERSDHYLMSLCQYIIGPPSSFSMWASYIGNTKLCHLHSEQETIGENSFSVCEG
ncbi:MAG: alpha-1,2-fucosyltransferase [Bacteroidia bacterium]